MNIQEATALGVIIGAVAAPFVKVIISLFKKDTKDYNDNKSLTYREFLNEKDTIYNDMDIKIEKATKELATKESVSHLSEGFIDLKKNVEKKFDEFQKTLQDMAINIAVLAERRGQPRE